MFEGFFKKGIPEGSTPLNAEDEELIKRVMEQSREFDQARADVAAPHPGETNRHPLESAAEIKVKDNPHGFTQLEGAPQPAAEDVDTPRAA